MLRLVSALASSVEIAKPRPPAVTVANPLANSRRVGCRIAYYSMGGWYVVVSHTRSETKTKASVATRPPTKSKENKSLFQTLRYDLAVRYALSSYRSSMSNLFTSPSTLIEIYGAGSSQVKT